MQELQEVTAALAEELRVPGVAVGVLLDGQEHHAFHGVTSVENPLPVDERTLFLCGSTTKTLTATAIVRLVEQGLVDLDALVRTYLPEFRTADEEAAASVTVLQMLNHTAGWDGDLLKDTGDGDDALALYVDAMAGLRQVTRPGEAVSYNNASFGLAGRLVEKVSEMPYEDAVRALLLEPLGLEETMFFSRRMLTRRFAVDHQRLQDGGTNVLPSGLPALGEPRWRAGDDDARPGRVGAFPPPGRRIDPLVRARPSDAGADRPRAGLVGGRRRRHLVAAERRRRALGRRARRGNGRPALALPDRARTRLCARLLHELRSRRV